MNGGDAVAADPLDKVIVDVECIDRTEFRLDGIRPLQLILVVCDVQDSGGPNRAMRIDQSRSDDLGP